MDTTSLRTAALAAALAALAGCGNDAGFHPQPDGGDASTPDAADATSTDATDDLAHTDASPDHHDAAADDCGETGCRPCTPGERRCDPSRPSVVQTCAEDGGLWIQGQDCAATAGMTCGRGACVDVCATDQTGQSYQGCEFWPVTLGNPLIQFMGDFPFAVALENPQSYAVTVTIDGAMLSPAMTQTIAAGASAVVQLPWVRQLYTANPSTILKQNGAYHVRATAPVIAYQFNPLTFQSTAGLYSYSNDASLLLPSASLTQHYTALTAAGGYVAIVGTSDTPTQVTVTPTADIVAGPGVTAATAGTAQTYTLARGDVVQLGSTESGDLSGTRIESTQPVAVYAGHPCAAFVPLGEEIRSALSCDHLEDQLLPNEAWGRRYAVSAFIDRPGRPSFVRVLAVHDGTHLTFDPPSVAPHTTTLGADHFVEFLATEDFVLSSDQPVLVAQYMVTADRVMGDGGTNEGDPSLVYEVPVEQYRNYSAFFAPDTYTRNFVNIVGATATPPLLDDAPIAATGRPIGGSGLTVWSVELTPGPHHVGTIDMSATYGVKVYGTAPFCSYAYPGGMDLQAIAPPG